MIEAQRPLQGKLRHLERTARALENLAYQQHAVYVETGAHRGRSIGALIPRLIDRCQTLQIRGYDLFDMANDDSNQREQNGKGFGDHARCQAVCERLQSGCPNLTYELIMGDTRDTLLPTVATWAYIDGGHSYETVKWDHQQLQHSHVIVFDDADLEPVNHYLWEIRDTYTLWDLQIIDGTRQVAIVNSDQYDYDRAGFNAFQGQDPKHWRSTR